MEDSDVFAVKLSELRLIMGEDRAADDNTVAYEIVLSIDREGEVRGFKLLLPNLH